MRTPARGLRALRRPAALLAAALALAAAAVGGPGAPVAAAADVTIYSSGSSWSANAMDQWIADMSHQGVPIQFNVSSSGQGRQDFSLNQVDFANSDIPYQGVDPLTGQQDNSTRPFAYMPIVAGGTALMYHLQQGSNLIRNVRLSGQTVARIFTGGITYWNDPAITADMNGQALPAKKIQVVVESNGSGTTAQFTDWLTRQYGSIWGAYEGSPNQPKPTSYFPVNSPNMTAQNGDAQVAQTITSSGYDGAIGYVQYSYALNVNYPAVKVENAAHYFASPNPYNVAVALTQAKIHDSPQDKQNNSVYLTQDLTNVYSNSDPRSYPLSSYSYSIIPVDPNDVRTDANRARTFADFARYFMCQGQNNMPTLGYSPLTVNLVAEGFAQVQRYSHIDPSAAGGLDATKCNNPTYYPQDPSKNRLAEIDPAPPSCDMAGQGPCGTDNNANPTKNGPGAGAGSGAGGGAGSGGGGGAAGGGAGGAGAGGGGGPAAAGGVDPGTGLPLGSAGAGNGTGVAPGTATDLAAFRSTGMNRVLGILAAVELVLVLLVPAVVARAAARRRAKNDGNG